MVGLSLCRCVCVCLLVTFVFREPWPCKAKTADTIEMSFRQGWARDVKARDRDVCRPLDVTVMLK